MNTSELFSCFGDVIELGFPSWNIDSIGNLLDNHTGWKPYNPRKNIRRFGLSITSLDGQYSGVPDLDSLLEYNKLNGTNYSEIDFQKRTDIVDQLPQLKDLLDIFDNSLGRCHFLKLDAGGFFPPHRDNGPKIPSPSFRVIVPLTNCIHNRWFWIHDGKILNMIAGNTYCINTTKEHSIFSFVDNCCMLVLNVLSTEKSLRAVTNNLKIK